MILPKAEPTHEAISERLIEGVHGDIRSISIIGSYLISDCVRPGSDIDIIVVTEDLDETQLDFGETIYKDVVIEDSMGRRKEQNIAHDDVVLDITVIDRFNSPNNPLTDNYENAIGSCIGSLAIFGDTLENIFDIRRLIDDYEVIRPLRLEIVEDKIRKTSEKIQEQLRTDFHILYELQKYIFTRECVRRSIFPQFSIKHPELSIPDFNGIFRDALKACGVKLEVNRI